MKIRLLVNWAREDCKHLAGDVIDVSKKVGERLVAIGQAAPSGSGKKEAAAITPAVENAAEAPAETR